MIDEILHGYMAAQLRLLHQKKWTDRAGRISGKTEETVMSNDNDKEEKTELTKPNLQTLDGFSGFEDGIQGDDRPQGGSVIQGNLVKFTNESTWVTREGEELSPTLELVAIDICRLVQRWKDQQPVETRILAPGEKFPDVHALNETVPKEEWVKGPDGQLHGPWQSQYLLYLLDPATMSKFTYPTGTVGGGIGIRDLRDKVMWMRKFRGPNTYAVVTLSDTFMKTRFGGRQRHNFLIKRWVGMGGGSGEPNKLEHKPSPSTVPLGAHEVKPPTIAEELNDDLSDFLK